MRSIKLAIVTCVLMVVNNLTAYTQSLPVGTPGIEDFYRRNQLSGEVDSSISFTVRPLFPIATTFAPNQYTADSALIRKSISYSTNIYSSNNKLLQIDVLPVSYQMQFNSHHPVDWNDGAMIPAKGMQSLISGGIYLKYGPLTVQFRPEIINASNAEFETMHKDHYDTFVARYYDIYNNIDLPVRFGTDSYTKVLLGQSSIRLNFKALSVGLSNENLWWGPGIRNSLLMSNTAPGFKHFTFNTIKPIKTAIGSFEGQIIGGRLENSGFAPLTPDRFYFGTNLYVPKPNDWRYLSGMVLTWQPKWVPGLFLGFDRSAQMYGKDVNKIGDFLPFFSNTTSVSSPDQPIDQKDQLSSLFMRWLWREEQAEIYFQYAKYNSKQDITQAILTPNDSRAYIFGLRKMISFNRLRNENLLIGIEISQLQQTSIEKIAKGKEFYVSQSIRAGYTHMGQALGAGIGPGGNSQTVSVSWLKGLKRIGIQLERRIHDNDFYYYAFTDSKDFRRHWVDLSVSVGGEWDYKNFIFNTRLQALNSLNYQWYLKERPGDVYFVNGISAANIQATVGVTYRF